jgi:hypothetical protein
MQRKQVVSAAVLNAYKRLTHDQLVLFTTLRGLLSTGSHLELADRLANHDVDVYPIPAILPVPHPDSLQKSASSNLLSLPTDLAAAHSLPIELVVDILDHVGDWELSKVLGVATSLRHPREWNHASELDYAVLSGQIHRVRSATGPLSKPAAVASIRFGYTSILDYLHTNRRPDFEREYGRRGELLPAKASLYGCTQILDWWLARIGSNGKLIYNKDAIDGACRNGHVAVLDWWKRSGLELKYSDASLEHASAVGHIPVLDWWKRSGLQLRIGRVMEGASGAGHVDVLEWWHTSKLDFKYDRIALFNASCNGRVEVLDWWLQSGLQMIFDTDTLAGATKYNRVEVLKWWDRSKLPIQYRPVDIEEALEDALRGGQEARQWWEKKGVDFKTNNAEWMQVQCLN